MVDDPIAHDIATLRRANELALARFGAVFASVMAVVSLARLFTQFDAASLQLMALIVGYAVLYSAWSVFKTSTHTDRWLPWLATTMEVSFATFAVAIDLPHGADFALQNTPAALYVVTIFASVVRLRPEIAIYGGALATVQWSTMYYLIWKTGEITDPSLAPAFAIQRSAMLFMGGILASQITRSMLQLAYRSAHAAAERERTRRAFGRYVADPVVERVLRGDLHLRPEQREVTVLFVDIRNFTQTTAQWGPDQVLTRLSRVLDRFGLQVQRHQGIVNKYLGDGLLALFGAPEVDPDHASHAFEAACAILEEARHLHQIGEWPDLKIGIGLASGMVITGDVGGHAQREYTAIGDVVNLASRLEQATKLAHTPLLLDRSTASAIHDTSRLQEVAPITIRGLAEPVHAWALREPHAQDAAPVDPPPQHKTAV